MAISYRNVEINLRINDAKFREGIKGVLKYISEEQNQYRESLNNIKLEHQGITDTVQNEATARKQINKLLKKQKQYIEDTAKVMQKILSFTSQLISELGEGSQEASKIAGYIKELDGIIQSFASGNILGGIFFSILTIVKGIKDIISQQTDQYTEQEKTINQILDAVTKYEKKIQSIQKSINAINSMRGDEASQLREINRLLKAQSNEAMKILNTTKAKLVEILKPYSKVSYIQQIIDILEASGTGVIENLADLQQAMLQAPYGWREDVQELFDQLLSSNEQLADLFAQIGMNAERLARLPFEAALEKLQAEGAYLKEIGQDLTNNLLEQIQTLEHMLSLIDDEVERYKLMTEIARLRNQLEANTLDTMRDQLRMTQKMGQFLDIQNVINQQVIETRLRQAGLSGLELNEALQTMGIVGRTVGDLINSSTIGTVINNYYPQVDTTEPSLNL